MSRRYLFAPPDPVAITAPHDIFEVLAPPNAIVRILAWEIFQTSDFGDLQEEIVMLSTKYGIGPVAAGTGGVAADGGEIDAGDPGFGGVVRCFNSTRMAVGTGTLWGRERRGWNVRMPRERIYTPETQPIISPGDRWTISLPFSPVDALTISGTLELEQIGG